MNPSTSHFGDLRSLLHQPPSPEAWDALWRILDELPADTHEAALSYAAEHLERWPCPLRRVPTAHLIPFIQGSAHLGAQLARSLDATALPHHTLTALAHCPYLPQLTHLTLRATQLTDDLAASILKYTPNLVALHLPHNKLSEATLRVLSHTRQLSSLTSLDLSRNDLKLESGRLLLTALTSLATACPLRHLDLSHNPLGRSGLFSLLRSLHLLPSLTSLQLAATSLDQDAAHLLADAAPTSLTTLDLSHNPLGNVGVANLCRAPWLPQLTRLRLRDVLASDHAATLLCGAPLSSLVELDLRDNPLSQQAIHQLTTSALAPTLRL
jgi:hypothetical protein